MLKRAVEIIEKPKPSKKQCRRQEETDIDIDAKNASRFLTGDNTIDSTADENSQSSNSNYVADEEYCYQEEFVIEGSRKVSNNTINRILQLHDK